MTYIYILFSVTVLFFLGLSRRDRQNLRNEFRFLAAIFLILSLLLITQYFLAVIETWEVIAILPKPDRGDGFVLWMAQVEIKEFVEILPFRRLADSILLVAPAALISFYYFFFKVVKTTTLMLFASFNVAYFWYIAVVETLLNNSLTLQFLLIASGYCVLIVGYFYVSNFPSSETPDLPESGISFTA